MLKMKIYSIDLKLDDNNYSSFSGWFISDKQITNEQITSLISTIQEPHQNLSLKSLDSEGEELEDYCDEFEYFDLEKIREGAIICLDLNYLEDYDSEIDIESVFLTNSENNIIKFLPDGSLSSI